jgi:hypothetical protein
MPETPMRSFVVKVSISRFLAFGDLGSAGGQTVRPYGIQTQEPSN